MHFVGIHKFILRKNAGIHKFIFIFLQESRKLLFVFSMMNVCKPLIYCKINKHINLQKTQQVRTILVYEKTILVINRSAALHRHGGTGGKREIVVKHSRASQKLKLKPKLKLDQNQATRVLL